MPPAATDTRATSAHAEAENTFANSAFLGFVHRHCLRRTQNTAALLAEVRLDPSPGAVHDLRVAARRLVYTIECFATLLNPERTAAFRKRVKAILSAARPVRDIDVALDLAAASGLGPDGSLADSLRLQRDAAARIMGERLQRKRLQNLTQRWLRTAIGRLPACTKRTAELTPANGGTWTPLPWMPDQSCAANASHVLPTLAGQYFRHGRTVCVEGTSPEQLHELRLAGKRLRYCLELFAELYGPSLYGRLKILRDIQRKLGVLSDCDATITLLRSSEMPSDPASEQFQTILLGRQSEAIESFLEYWTCRLGDLEVEQEWRDYLTLSPEGDHQ